MMEEKACNVLIQIHGAQQTNVLRNWEIISSIIKTVLICGVQGLPLQGHHSRYENIDDPDINHGNFLELLKFHIDAGDKVLDLHL